MSEELGCYVNEIMLSDLFNFDGEDLSRWKICLNNQKGTDWAKDIYSLKKSKDERDILLNHIGYKINENRSKNFRIIEDKCLQFIRLDRDGIKDQWLFLGAFVQTGETEYVEEGVKCTSYKLAELQNFAVFQERLIIEYKKKQGPVQNSLNIKEYKNIKVKSILEGLYENELPVFVGYSSVNIPFKVLKKIVSSNVIEWKKPLSRINAIYVITDTNKNKLYIGSCYGEEGLWQRWCTYANTEGTGGNKLLKVDIYKDKQYAYENYTFTIVESFIKNKSDKDFILGRESYWKDVFLTRTEGLNEN